MSDFYETPVTGTRGSRHLAGENLKYFNTKLGPNGYCIVTAWHTKVNNSTQVLSCRLKVVSHAQSLADRAKPGPSFQL
jgi:hypothetical protein